MTPNAYKIFVSPKDRDEATADLTGDDKPDLLTITTATDDDGVTSYGLRDYPSGSKGDLFVGMSPSYGETTKNTAYADGCTTTPVDWKDALITHGGDYYPGDGLQDLVARMNDGTLYVYPGDGFGGFNTCARMPVLLPTTGTDTSGANVTVPAASAFDQILAAGDITGDGQPELFMTSGTQYWAFTGYTGGSFASATLLNTGSAWTTRDLVAVSDISGDGIADMLYRTTDSGQADPAQGQGQRGGHRRRHPLPRQLRGGLGRRRHRVRGQRMDRHRRTPLLRHPGRHRRLGPRHLGPHERRQRPPLLRRQGGDRRLHDGGRQLDGEAGLRLTGTDRRSGGFSPGTW